MEWNCLACTLLNPNENTTCEACGGNKTTTTTTTPWSCQTCTYQNEFYLDKCKMCSRAKPAPVNTSINQNQTNQNQNQNQDDSSFTDHGSVNQLADVALATIVEPEPLLTAEQVQKMVQTQQETRGDSNVSWWEWKCECGYVSENDEVKCKACRTPRPFKPVDVDLKDEQSQEGTEGEKKKGRIFPSWIKAHFFSFFFFFFFFSSSF